MINFVIFLNLDSEAILSIKVEWQFANKQFILLDFKIKTNLTHL